MRRTRTARRPALPVATARRIARQVVAWEGATAEVAVTFLGPVRMRRLNRDHLGHDAVTDVISFGLPTPDGSLLGDVYICQAEARRNASVHDVPVREELIRLVVHGTLHVLGLDHPDGDARTSSPMWRRQERYVRRILRRAG
jgi:probable rRNA maturation factor